MTRGSPRRPADQAGGSGQTATGAALLLKDPETFFGVIVRLATGRADQLRELLTEAWRLAAPKRLVRELDEA